MFCAANAGKIASQTSHRSRHDSTECAHWCSVLCLALPMLARQCLKHYTEAGMTALRVHAGAVFVFGAANAGKTVSQTIHPKQHTGAGMTALKVHVCNAVFCVWRCQCWQDSVPNNTSQTIHRSRHDSTESACVQRSVLCLALPMLARQCPKQYIPNNTQEQA